MPAACTFSAKTGRVDFEPLSNDGSDSEVRLNAGSSHVDYIQELTNWICDDLEQNWKTGTPKPIVEYQSTFPELFHHKPAIQSIVNFDYSLRLRSGEHPSASSYLPIWGVTPRMANDVSTQTPGPARTIDQTVLQAVVPLQAPQKKWDEHHPTQKLSIDPSEYDEFEQVSKEEFPVVGQMVEGFHLKEMLGRGAFAQVYLAEQVGLSNRLVALKLTRRLGKEAGRLARLQHANVVPIFSFHSGREWQAICMPFFGRQTLDDIIRTVRESRRIPKSGCEVFSTVAAKADSTVKSSSSFPANPTKFDVIRPSDAGSHGKLRNVLTHLPFSDAAVLLVAQMVDGLAHAHSLGIWHLDLKPANVLISDHGQPMLLDFNLAFDTAREDRQRFGGTVAYMAPEQIDEMIESRRRHQAGITPTGPRVSKVDHRSDLFSIGVILFELLTGRHPFPVSKSDKDPFEAARIVRELPRPTARQLNPSISRGIDAIIERLLSNRMQDRYPSALALRQDLIGHLEHRTLVYIKEPSLIERFRKWHYRHPKVLTRIVASASVGLAVSALSWGYSHWNHSARLAARDQILAFRQELPPLRLDLADYDQQSYLVHGLNRATALFESLRIDETTDLNEVPCLKNIDSAERTTTLADLGEVAVLASLAARSDKYAVSQQERERTIEKWQTIAEKCFQGQHAPAILGGDDFGTRSDFISATIALRDGRVNDAIAKLEKIVIADPQHAAAHSLMASALLTKQSFDRAGERNVMAAALMPNDPRPKLDRAKILQQERNFPALESCLTELINIDRNAQNLYNRALSRVPQKKFAEALKDCNEAYDLTGPFYRLLQLRSFIHTQMGHAKEAKDDKEAMRECTPTTYKDFFVRGYDRSMAKDYLGAIDDYRVTVSMNPRLYEAWFNLAFIYSENLKNAQTAMDVIEDAIEANAQNGDLRLFHALLLARKGDRIESHQEVDASLNLLNKQPKYYNAACVYALTSRTNPEDAEQAVKYLKESFRARDRSITPEKVLKDSDLKPIIDRPDVKQLIEALKSLN